MTTRPFISITQLPGSASLILMILSFASCTTIYRPALQQVPMFQKKGDLQLSVADKNAAVAYSFSSSFGVVASGYYRDRSQSLPSSDKSSNYTGYGRSISLALGYYKILPHGSFEVFGGYGKGYTSLYFHDSYLQGKGGAASNFNSYFIQPAFVLTNRDDDISYGFSCRLVVLNLYDFKDVNQAFEIPQTPVFFEPGFTLCLKSGPVAFKAQSFISAPLEKEKGNSVYYDAYQPMVVINGVLELHVSQLFKKKPNRK